MNAKAHGNAETIAQSSNNKALLRVVTCGSAQAGKSNLIGCLAQDAKIRFEDQHAALAAEATRTGLPAEHLRFNVPAHGLCEDHKQAIPIDVAFRAFATAQRNFIFADAPGDELHTRNMATGASSASAAIIVVDAPKGIVTQTRRHSYIVALLGIRHIVLAVNKMDLVGYDRAVFDTIAQDYRAFTAKLDIEDVTCIPVSALKGDNLIAPGNAMDWYSGPTLMAHLDRVPAGPGSDDQSLRMPVYSVERTDGSFDAVAGQIASGVAHCADRIKVVPSGRIGTLERIVTENGDRDLAIAGQCVTLMFAGNIDASRGSVICSADDPVEVADQFETQILWMGDEPMLPGRPYVINCGTQSVPGQLATLKYKLNVISLEHTAANTLELNEIAVCNLALESEIPFTSYAENHSLGSFAIIDRFTGTTVGMGLINFALRRASNIHWQALDVNKATRAGKKGQKPSVLWFTGLSGSGKSTIANLVEKRLLALGAHTYLLDGDNVRHGLNKDLGFTDADRVENIRRVAEVARLMADSGLIVLVSFISPFRSERLLARELMDEDEFFEVFIDTPLDVCEQRDEKGLYAKARRGETKNFTGIDSDYEAPDSPEIHLHTVELSAEDSAAEIVDFLDQRFRFNGHKA